MELFIGIMGLFISLIIFSILSINEDRVIKYIGWFGIVSITVSLTVTCLVVIIKKII